MDPSSACGFFDIILGLFLEAKVDTGKLIGVLQSFRPIILRTNAE